MQRAPVYRDLLGQLAGIDARRVPAEVYRTLAVPAPGTESDVFDVGVQRTWPWGWVMQSRAEPGANVRLNAALSLFNGGQGTEPLKVENIEWSAGGQVWIPYPRFQLGFEAVLVSGVAATSTVEVYARPVCPGEPLPAPVLTGSADIDALAGGATRTITVPNLATQYQVYIVPPAGGLLAHIRVIERITVAAASVNWNAYEIDADHVTQGDANPAGWRTTPLSPAGQIQLVNSGATPANDIACALRYKYDLLSTMR